MTNEELLAQTKQRTENISMTVVAYEALEVKRMLEKTESDNLSNDVIHTNLKNILMSASKGEAFTEAQAEAFAQRYTPVAALDQDGAGAMILRDNYTHKNIGLVRGTDIPANTVPDGKADIGIARGSMPVDQTVAIDNFFARETSPKGIYVSQMSAGIALGRDADVLGTGLAQEGLSKVVGHSKAGPIVSAMGALYKAETVTLNSPNTYGIESYVKSASRMTGVSVIPSSLERQAA